MKKILAMLTLPILVCGCNGVFDSAQTHTLRIEDKSVKCKVGDIIVVELDSNPTTGYQWTPVEYDDSALKIQNREYKSSGRLAGSGGVERISFVAINPGDADIRLQYVRPWEKAPANEVEFDVIVTP